MRLKRLIEPIDDLIVKGSKEIEITGLYSNSKLVSPGGLFIAKKGLNNEAVRFIHEAVAVGAVCVLTDMYDPFLPVTQLIHNDVAAIEAKLASRYYQEPSKELHVVGITGTNGKTTCSFLIKHFLDHAHIPTGLIGTIEAIVGSHRFPSHMTTPDVITNHKLLREMIQEGCKAAVMEVSSHGLEQRRVGEIEFDIALFTNFNRDHLDYHGSMEEYFKAKQKLFTLLEPDKWVIFNADDPVSFETKAQVLTYAVEKKADLMAKDIKVSDKSTQFTVSFQNQEVVFKSPLIGVFNVSNVLGALAAAVCSGVSLETCSAALKTFKQVPGRLERVKNDLGIHIFVDFAHKEQALIHVLKTLKALKQGKLITVFGCGGNRDPGKRIEMGRAVRENSDEAIITNDNPRNEDPQKIAEQILEAFHPGDPVIVELDREKAIRKAIESAKPNDMILIAGKGHEKQQIFAHQVLPFDDVEVAKALCQEKASLCS